jgi:type I restriction enzyme S subunit
MDLAVQGQLQGEDARKWPRRTVAEVLDRLQSGPFGSSLHQTDYESYGTPVINPASIQNGRIIPIPKMAVGPAVLDRLASFKVSSNDVVMARRGEMGRCAVVTPREHGWLCGTGCLVLHPAQGIFPGYLAMFIGAPRTRQYLNSASVGTTMQNLNQRILLGLEIVVPHLRNNGAS